MLTFLYKLHNGLKIKGFVGHPKAALAAVIDVPGCAGVEGVQNKIASGEPYSKKSFILVLKKLLKLI